MAFTYDPTTDRGRVRLLVADTNTAVAANQVFTDAEIDAFLSLAGSDVFTAAANACRAIAADASRSAIVWQALNETINKEAIPRHFRLLADKYDESAKNLPAEEIDSFDYQINQFGQQVGEWVGDTRYS